MSDFLADLAAQTIGAARVVLPLIEARYAAMPPIGGVGTFEGLFASADANAAAPGEAEPVAERDDLPPRLIPPGDYADYRPFSLARIQQMIEPAGWPVEAETEPSSRADEAGVAVEPAAPGAALAADGARPAPAEIRDGEPAEQHMASAAAPRPDAPAAAEALSPVTEAPADAAPAASARGLLRASAASPPAPEPSPAPSSEATPRPGLHAASRPGAPAQEHAGIDESAGKPGPIPAPARHAPGTVAPAPGAWAQELPPEEPHTLPRALQPESSGGPVEGRAASLPPGAAAPTEEIPGAAAAPAVPPGAPASRRTLPTETADTRVERAAAVGSPPSSPADAPDPLARPVLAVSPATWQQHTSAREPVAERPARLPTEAADTRVEQAAIVSSPSSLPADAPDPLPRPVLAVSPPTPEQDAHARESVVQRPARLPAANPAVAAHSTAAVQPAAARALEHAPADAVDAPTAATSPVAAAGPASPARPSPIQGAATQRAPAATPRNTPRPDGAGHAGPGPTGAVAPRPAAVAPVPELAEQTTLTPEHAPSAADSAPVERADARAHAARGADAAPPQDAGPAAVEGVRSRSAAVPGAPASQQAPAAGHDARLTAAPVEPPAVKPHDAQHASPVVEPAPPPPVVTAAAGGAKRAQPVSAVPVQSSAPAAVDGGVRPQRAVAAGKPAAQPDGSAASPAAHGAPGVPAPRPWNAPAPGEAQSPAEDPRWPVVRRLVEPPGQGATRSETSRGDPTPQTGAQTAAAPAPRLPGTARDEPVVRPVLPPEAAVRGGPASAQRGPAVDEPAAGRTIRVTIGRIEVRSATPAGPPSPAPAGRPRPALSLDDYLKRPGRVRP